MARRLAGWPGEWRFVDAVDGRTLQQDLNAVYDEARALRTCGRRLSPPELGCALSHRRVYEIIARESVDTALVLEDDACFAAELARFPFWSLGSGFDIINLYTVSGLVRSRPHARRAGVALHRAAGRVDNTVAYVISAAGAAKLLAATQPIRSVADWPLPPERLDFYVAFPFPVQHPDSGSLIEGERERALSAQRATDRWARLTRGFLASLTVPLFIKYVLRRERYVDAADYYRREIAYKAKRLLPMFYFCVGRAGWRA